MHELNIYEEMRVICLSRYSLATLMDTLDNEIRKHRGYTWVWNKRNQSDPPLQNKQVTWGWGWEVDLIITETRENYSEFTTRRPLGDSHGR